MFAQDQSENAFLAGLSPTEFAVLHSHLVPFDLRVADRLHYQGEPVDRIIFPQSGLVVMTMPVSDDHWAGVALVDRDGLIGGFAAAASTMATCDAEVQIAGQGWRMSALAFRDILDRHPSIRQHAARFDSAMMAQAQQTALCHAAHSVEARVCRWLLDVQDRIGGGSADLDGRALPAPDGPLTKQTIRSQRVIDTATILFALVLHYKHTLKLLLSVPWTTPSLYPRNSCLT
jgi:CRP-like cAMP-binding protein